MTFDSFHTKNTNGHQYLKILLEKDGGLNSHKLTDSMSPKRVIPFKELRAGGTFSAKPRMGGPHQGKMDTQ